MADFKVTIDEKAKKYLEEKGIYDLTIRLVRAGGG